MKSAYLALIFLLFGCQSPDYDIIIKGGTIYDGSSSEAYIGDIGIKSGKILTIGDLKDASAEKTINADGLAVSPGFIDMHTHLEPIMEMPLAESLVRQGVTLH